MERFYQDFLSLRKGLEVRFPGVCVPPVPLPKHALFGPALLAQFLQCVVDHPFLGQDPLVDGFVNKESFDAQASFKAKRPGLFKSHELSAAATRWAQAMASQPTPEDLAKTSTQASLRLSKVRLQIEALDKSLAAEVNSTSVAASNSAKLGEALQEWSQAEQQASPDSAEFHAATNAAGEAQARRGEMLQVLSVSWILMGVGLEESKWDWRSESESESESEHESE